MENTIIKIPFFIETRCSHCGKENRINLQSTSLQGEGSFKYQCLHCKQPNDLFEDKEFIDFSQLLVEHKDKYRDFVLRALSEMAVKLFEENKLDLDEEIIHELRKLPREKLQEGILSVMRGETPKID